MKCLNDNCKVEFESSNNRKKFCSGKCKLAHFRKHGKKNELKLFQMQVLYNQIMDAVNKIGQGNGLPPAVGAVIENPKQEIEVKQPSTVNGYQNWHFELNECQNVSEIEFTMKEVWADAFLAKWEKVKLENFAKEKSKDFYTD